MLLLSCGQRLPTPYPSPTPPVAPLPSPEPTRCLQPREWRPPAGKNSGDMRDLGDVHPSADNPHVLDGLLLRIADSMQAIGAQSHDIVPTEPDALGQS
jgi:hypothetical protein